VIALSNASAAMPTVSDNVGCGVHIVPYQVPLAGHGPRWQVVSADIPIIASLASA
jgi:hypothetical protein